MAMTYISSLCSCSLCFEYSTFLRLTEVDLRVDREIGPREILVTDRVVVIVVVIKSRVCGAVSS